MSKLTRESVEKVRAASDIGDVISGYTELRQRGNRMLGLCPFHDERTPSFSVNSTEGLYYCFGCQAGGDVFTFLREKDGLEFADAVEQLADRYGVEVTYEHEDPKAEERRRQRERLLEVVGKAAAFYERYLGDSDEAAKARRYLEQRGLGSEVLAEFGVGYAPSAWDSMLTRAQRAGFREQELLAAGLTQRGKQGGFYDRFRGRIMFPLRDARGRVLGFGARALGKDQMPKYVNSPESEIYHKGRQLFGIDLARSHVTKAGEAIVVEGYTDAIALHQAGIRNVVAAMGTVMTDEQVAELARLAKTVVLAFDADSSGQEAMLKVQKAAAGRGIDLKVVRLPDDKDPCDLLQEAGPDDFAGRVQEASSFLEFQVGTVMDGADTSSASGKDRVVAQLGPIFAQATPSAERDEQIRRVADRLGLGEHWLTPALAGVKTSTGEIAPQGAPTAAGRYERSERIFLAMCVSSGERGRSYLGRLGPKHFSSDQLRRAHSWLREHFDAPTDGLAYDDQELARTVSEIVVRADRQPVDENALDVGFLGLEQRRVETEIKLVAQAGDFDRQQQLAVKRSEIIDEIAELMGGASASLAPRTGASERG